MGDLFKRSLSGIVVSCIAFFIINSIEIADFYEMMMIRSSNVSEISQDAGIIVNTQLERGKYVSEDVTPEELYEAYLSIRDDYSEKAFHCNSESSKVLHASKKGKKSIEKCKETWKNLRSTEDGIEVSILEDPSDPSCPYVRMSAVMPGSSDDVWNFLRFDNWESTMPRMDPFYDSLDINKRYLYHLPKLLGFKSFHPVEMVLARKKYSRMLTFGKRDFTFVQVSDVPNEDGVRISGVISIITNRLPRMRGYTRAFQNSIAFYEELSEDMGTNGELSTRVTVVGRVDLNDSSNGGNGGNIPMWLYVKTVGSTGVHFCRNMRKELRRAADEKENMGKVSDMYSPYWIRDNNVESNVETFVSLYLKTMKKMSMR